MPDSTIFLRFEGGTTNESQVPVGEATRSYFEAGFEVGLSNAPVGDAFTEVYRPADGLVANLISDNMLLLTNTTGKPFGVISMSVNGLLGLGTPEATPRYEGEVEFVFFGTYMNEAMTNPFSVTTTVDASKPFEVIDFKNWFASGLKSFGWMVIPADGVASDAWGVIDNIEIYLPTGPELQAVDPVALDGGDVAEVQLVAVDPEDDPVTYRIDGDVPAGVSINTTTGVVTIASLPTDEDLEPGDAARIFTFSVVAESNDGVSEAQTVSVTINPYDSKAGELIFADKKNKPNPLTGTKDDDIILGWQNNDTLMGGRGDDSLSGYNDKDLLLGGSGKDTIDGGNGSDTIDGGRGEDHLYGGSAQDIFVFGRGSGNDKILDFDLKNDRLRFEGEIVRGDLTVSYGGGNAYVAYLGDDGETHTLSLIGVKVNGLSPSVFLFD